MAAAVLAFRLVAERPGNNLDKSGPLACRWQKDEAGKLVCSWRREGGPHPPGTMIAPPRLRKILTRRPTG